MRLLEEAEGQIRTLEGNIRNLGVQLAKARKTASNIQTTKEEWDKTERELRERMARLVKERDELSETIEGLREQRDHDLAELTVLRGGNATVEFTAEPCDHPMRLVAHPAHRIDDPDTACQMLFYNPRDGSLGEDPDR